MKTTDLHREDVRAALRKGGLYLADVARQLDVDRTAIYHVLDGRTRSERIEKALADASGYSLEEIQSVTRRSGRGLVGRNIGRNTESAQTSRNRRAVGQRTEHHDG